MSVAMRYLAGSMKNNDMHTAGVGYTCKGLYRFDFLNLAVDSLISIPLLY